MSSSTGSVWCHKARSRPRLEVETHQRGAGSSHLQAGAIQAIINRAAVPRHLLPQAAVRDQTQPRIRIESEAVLTLLGLPAERLEFLRSRAHDLENDQNPVSWRAARVRDWLAARPLIPTPEGLLLPRTRELTGLGFGSFDALHLASAESAVASAFLTVDDRLIAAARRAGSGLQVAVREPVSFLREAVP